MVTPISASFDAAGEYQPPSALNPKSNHSHAVDRSRFTAMLLPYTEKWPLVHAILVEKDSRRIFYFMVYVLRFY